jgi:hypothetical protein
MPVTLLPIKITDFFGNMFSVNAVISEYHLYLSLEFMVLLELL